MNAVALDPETLEPVADEYAEPEGTLADTFGGEDAYRSGVLDAMRAEGGMA